MSNDIIETKAELARVDNGGSEVAALIRTALEHGKDPTELYAILREERAARAEQAFNAAFVRFKAACPPVIRATTDQNPRMGRINREGVKVARKYATLEDIAAVVDGPLLAVGLTYDFTASATTPSGLLTRCFVLRHVGGHAREPVLSPPIPIEGTESWKSTAGERGDSSASPSQRVMIADATAKRAALLAGLSLAMYYEDADYVTDSNGLTHEQIADLTAIIQTVGESRGTPINVAAFCKIFKASELKDIPAARYEEAVAKLEGQRKAKETTV